MTEVNNDLNDKNIPSEDTSPRDTGSEVDSSSFETLQNLAEASLDRLEESMSGLNTASKDKCIPGPLPKEGKVFSEIKEALLGLIAKSETEEEQDMIISYTKPERRINSEVQKAALLSHTFAAYISTLDKNLVCRIAMQIVSDTSLWLSKIFRFFDSLAYFSKDCKEGLIRVIRMVLHMRYLRYSSTGYEALFTRPPVIYYCDPDAHNVGKYLSYLCSQLGLPLSCITAVPSLSGANDDQFKMDTAALEKCIKDDLSATKTPLLVIANAGSNVVGHVDNLQKIQEICLAHNVWLHINGHNLAALSLVIVPNLPSNLGDSMTLSLGDWIGLPSLPYITLYKAKEMAHVHAAGLGQASYGHLDFLPIWFAVQTLGYNTLTQMIRHSFELADLLLQQIEKFPELRIISKRKPVPKDGNQHDVSTIGEKSIPTMVLFEALTPVIVFQYIAKADRDQETTERNPPYYDNLNSWLVQLMARQVPTIKTEILDLTNFGVCLRLCPLENANILGSTKKDVEQYFVCLQEQIEILNATVRQKEELYRDFKKYPKLQLVEIANWAGMGGVRYIPEFWVDRLNELTDTGKADINLLNSELVAKLKASDSAFSLGEADDGMLCVRFGMVDADLNLEELMNLVTSAGQELEESSKFLETMSEIIKQGIEEANKELIQENQEKIMQEGVLRQVPVLGSFVSWWYPTPKETGIKGRSFNLSSGTIESTENIYKYHMQIKEGSKSPSTSTKFISRSSSLSSNADQKSSPTPSNA
ncbi:pyridoxal-dependent decarboxylase domain-containing protein 1 [Trichonephila inaurata madagascariensis]|uniref:Pyridoxal-dependent decarboxylase domain-containing protein 1 n=1 Tax=Trichonephila inaurata madagascariensis TaxID=2747483 RepID=A0A8X6JQ72_9ARAC|nr:pyridoxal-dependent decarboxylase domain-containing protein 1 [Trichonephila inaurata madagascariensis]